MSHLENFVLIASWIYGVSVIWIKQAIWIKFIPPTSFYLFSVATKKFKSPYLAHICDFHYNPIGKYSL